MSLSDFRVDGSAPPPLPKVGPAPLVFQDGDVLAIDQSITATGWVHLSHDRDGLHVLARGSVLLPPAGYPKGYGGMLLRADALVDALDDIMRRLPVTDVVHEMPAMSVGKKMARPESSLMGAVAVRAVAQRHGHPVTMIQNQHSKKVLVNNGNADKKEWHTVLDRLTWLGPGPSNEGQRDAMCLGLTHLIEMGD